MIVQTCLIMRRTYFEANLRLAEFRRSSPSKLSALVAYGGFLTGLVERCSSQVKSVSLPSGTATSGTVVRTVAVVSSASSTPSTVSQTVKFIDLTQEEEGHAKVISSQWSLFLLPRVNPTSTEHGSGFPFPPASLGGVGSPNCTDSLLIIRKTKKLPCTNMLGHDRTCIKSIIFT